MAEKGDLQIKVNVYQGMNVLIYQRRMHLNLCDNCAPWWQIIITQPTPQRRTRVRDGPTLHRCTHQGENFLIPKLQLFIRSGEMLLINEYRRRDPVIN